MGTYISEGVDVTTVIHIRLQEEPSGGSRNICQYRKLLGLRGGVTPVIHIRLQDEPSGGSRTICQYISSYIMSISNIDARKEKSGLWVHLYFRGTLKKCVVNTHSILLFLYQDFVK